MADQIDKGDLKTDVNRLSEAPDESVPSMNEVLEDSVKKNMEESHKCAKAIAESVEHIDDPLIKKLSVQELAKTQTAIKALIEVNLDPLKELVAISNEKELNQIALAMNKTLETYGVSVSVDKLEDRHSSLELRGGESLIVGLSGKGMTGVDLRTYDFARHGSGKRLSDVGACSSLSWIIQLSYKDMLNK
jgi:phage tail tape-measure protein